MQCYNTLLSNFPSIICQVVAYGRLKTKENFRILVLKVVAVAYERWTLTRGSKYSDLTWETFGILENWWPRRGGRLREVVVTGGSTVGKLEGDLYRAGGRRGVYNQMYCLVNRAAYKGLGEGLRAAVYGICFYSKRGLFWFVFAKLSEIAVSWC